MHRAPWRPPATPTPGFRTAGVRRPGRLAPACSWAQGTGRGEALKPQCVLNGGRDFRQFGGMSNGSGEPRSTADPTASADKSATQAVTLEARSRRRSQRGIRQRTPAAAPTSGLRSPLPGLLWRHGGSTTPPLSPPCDPYPPRRIAAWASAMSSSSSFMSQTCPGPVECPDRSAAPRRCLDAKRACPAPLPLAAARLSGPCGRSHHGPAYGLKTLDSNGDGRGRQDEPTT